MLIIEIIEGRKWVDNVTDFLLDNMDDIHVGDPVVFYAVADNAIKKLKIGQYIDTLGYNLNQGGSFVSNDGIAI